MQYNVNVTTVLSTVCIQVVSFMFDRHYENPDEPVTSSRFLNSCIYRLKAQSSLFGLPTQKALKVSTNVCSSSYHYLAVLHVKM